MYTALTHDAGTDSTPDPFTTFSPLNIRDMSIRRKFAICGFEEQAVRTAPYDDPDWVIMGLNMANRLGYMHDAEGRFRADVWFDLHEAHAQDAKDMAWIEACPVPIYLTHDFGTNPRRVVYRPDEVLSDIVDRFGRVPVRYFASSFAYMTAWALAMGATTIGYFGVNLGWGRERVVERGNLEYWIGFTQGCGVDIATSPASALLTHPALYGIEYDQEKAGVESICARTVRQLMQSKGVSDALDRDLVGRGDELMRLARECHQAVARLLYDHGVPHADR